MNPPVNPVHSVNPVTPMNPYHVRSPQETSPLFYLFSLIAAVLVILAVLLGENAFGQQKVSVVPTSYTTFTEYDGDGNPVYICRASVTQSASLFSIAYGNLTNISVVGGVGTVNFVGAHGFLPGYKLVITKSATTALNSTYRVVTADPAGSALTITTSGVSNGTYTDLTISTDTALLIKPVWAIRYFYWSGGNNLFSGWTSGNQDGYNQICANRGAVNGATVVTFK